MRKTQPKPFRISKWEVWAAYQQVKANQGAAGVDGQPIEERALRAAGRARRPAARCVQSCPGGRRGRRRSLAAARANWGGLRVGAHREPKLWDVCASNAVRRSARRRR